MASDKRTRILREGEHHVQQGKIDLAINEYLKVLKMDPQDVLILNTVGDLHLRQGRVSEANRIFLQVAENYAHNNFLLKAIAVYKKILNTDPQNLEVNTLLAPLYARQGMNVDARSQYLFLADLCTREGKMAESLEAYEKVVEIDPLNSPIQLKLAEAYLAQGMKDKACPFYVAAAHAQMKAGDIPAAVSLFQRAFVLNPASPEALKGLLETALQTQNCRALLDQFHESLANAPDDPALHELLGRAYLAAGDLDPAEQYFQKAISADDSRYEPFLSLSRAILEAGDPDRALHCLDAILPILISRRETEKALGAYACILEAHPAHVDTLKKLADVYSAANDDLRYVATLENLAARLEGAGNPGAALESLEKILQINPESEKHLDKHRELFAQAHPGAPYVLPRSVQEAVGRATSPDLQGIEDLDAREISTDDSSHSTIVEIDLLLNYGMKDKALELLRALEFKIPRDKDVRQRLVSLYRDAGEPRLAAEQCLLLSAIHKSSHDLEASQKSLNEARKLAPEWISADIDVVAFAQEHGINLEPARAEAGIKETGANPEIDLSGDLSEIFFQDAQLAPDLDTGGLLPASDAMVDEFPQAIPRAPAPESIEEQLQEVDFYIRLGFHDEARTKLEEIAGASPDLPEVAARCRQLGLESLPSAASPASAPPETAEPETIALPSNVSPDVVETFGIPGGNVLAGAGVGNAADRFQENRWFELDSDPAVASLAMPSVPPKAPVPMPAAERAPAIAASMEPPANFMFADLIEEVNALTDREIAREDFETHFSLGIAYREMGLTEDAIREFQSAVKALSPEKSSKELIQCCGMLSTCFLEKDMPRSAIRWCQTGLDIKEISSHEAMALRYDMAVAHSSAGEAHRALECFSMIFGVDPSYRDVAQRIDDLKSGLERHAP
jgi:tetratricopeptide (TPR) repeat protein